MKTVAKFVLNEITRHRQTKYVGKGESGVEKYENIELQSYKLTAVYSTDPSSENKQFWDATPQGLITLSTVRPHPVFDLGKELYVIFTDEKPEGV